MQVYYMYKDHIEVSHSTLALLFELLSFETVTVTLSIIGFLYQRNTISASMGNLKYLLSSVSLVGLNLMVMLLLIMAIFSRNAIKKQRQLHASLAFSAKPRQMSWKNCLQNRLQSISRVQDTLKRIR